MLWTVVLEKTLETPLDFEEIKPVNPKGIESWIFIGRTDAKAPILWPPDAKNWLIGKDPDAGKEWRQEEKGRTEDEMVGWHHWLNGHEFEPAPRVGEGWGSLACCSWWGCKELDVTEPNWNGKGINYEYKINRYKLLYVKKISNKDLLYSTGKIPWRRAWQPSPVFLPGESHNRGAWWATTVHRVAKVGHDWLCDLACTHTQLYLISCNNL